MNDSREIEPKVAGMFRCSAGLMVVASIVIATGGSSEARNAPSIPIQLAKRVEQAQGFMDQLASPENSQKS